MSLKNNMQASEIKKYAIELLLLISCYQALSHIEAIECRVLKPPIVINTWNFTRANRRAWDELARGASALDAVEAGCSECERDRCDGTVGWGGSPSESGETTLDAMLMDGNTYDVGAVGGLRRIRGAISVARQVLERTSHSLLVGEMATQFAKQLGFVEESLTSKESEQMHASWLNSSCQPNYWKNVQPDPRKSCGPYHVPASKPNQGFEGLKTREEAEYLSHDTIGMVAIDGRRKVAAGTSTNGARHKILGRVGDSPVAGAGAYAAWDAGAAAATGDGDVMMRFLLSYQAVENLRRGMSSKEAARDAISRMTYQVVGRNRQPMPDAAVIVLSVDGSYGAACSGLVRGFPFVVSDSQGQVESETVDCLTETNFGVNN